MASRDGVKSRETHRSKGPDSISIWWHRCALTGAATRRAPAIRRRCPSRWTSMSFRSVPAISINTMTAELVSKTSIAGAKLEPRTGAGRPRLKRDFIISIIVERSRSKSRSMSSPECLTTTPLPDRTAIHATVGRVRSARSTGHPYVSLSIRYQKERSGSTALRSLGPSSLIWALGIPGLDRMRPWGTGRARRPGRRAWATGQVEGDANLVGQVGAEMVVEAVLRAVKTATSLGGLPAHRDLHP